MKVTTTMYALNFTLGDAFVVVVVRGSGPAAAARPPARIARPRIAHPRLLSLPSSLPACVGHSGLLFAVRVCPTGRGVLTAVQCCHGRRAAMRSSHASAVAPMHHRTLLRRLGRALAPRPGVSSLGCAVRGPVAVAASPWQSPGDVRCLSRGAASVRGASPTAADAPAAAEAAPASGGQYPFREVEERWQRYWEANATFRTPEAVDTSKPKFYALDMFPYPRRVGAAAQAVRCREVWLLTCRRNTLSP